MTVSNSSTAVTHNIVCKRGDDFSRVFKYWTDTAGTVPLDITAADFSLEVRDTEGNLILDFTIGAGLSISLTNTLTATKTATEMLLEPGVYLYDIQKTASDTQTIMKGTFIIEGDVSEIEES